MRREKLILIVALGGISLILCPKARASEIPFTYETQSRSVSASSLATGFTRGGTDLSPTTNQQSQSQQAGGFGDFAGNAAANSTLGPGATSSSASANQTSSLGGSGFSASGSVQANSFFAGGGPATSSAASVFHITFDVQQAQTFAFTANLSSNNPAGSSHTSASVQLTDNLGNNVFAPIGTVNVANFQAGGTLAPGEYALTLDAKATSNDGTANSVNYNISLASLDGVAQFSAAALVAPGPAGVAGPDAVPLPPADISALLMLAALGVAGYVRRRRSGWVRLSML